MKNDMMPLPGKKYNSKGQMVKSDAPPGMLTLLARYAGASLEEAKAQCTEREYELLYRGRMVRSRLAAAVCNPKDLAKTRREIVLELIEPGENGKPAMTQQNATYIIRQILSTMAEAEALDRKTHRMVLDRRNQRAWEIAEEQKDVAAMNAADKNYIAIHQLDQEDKEKLNADDIQVQNLMATINYYLVAPDSGVSQDPWKDIREADKLATAGIIHLHSDKEAKKYVTTDIEDFEDFEEAEEKIGDKPL